MLLRIFTEPQQGAAYNTLLRVAKATEELGFDAFFRSDHYLKMGDVSGLPGPSDAWVSLAGLARETRRIRLGTLVTAATFRLPGPLAIEVANVDDMSGGRVELGLGAVDVPLRPTDDRDLVLVERREDVFDVLRNADDLLREEIVHFVVEDVAFFATELEDLLHRPMATVAARDTCNGQKWIS